MAKRKPERQVEPESKKPLSKQDQRTVHQITGLADRIQRQAAGRREPLLDIPMRSLSNVKFNTSRRILEMGK